MARSGIVFGLALLALAAAGPPAAASPAVSDRLYIYNRQHVLCLDVDGPTAGRWWLKDYGGRYGSGSLAMDSFSVVRSQVSFRDRSGVVADRSGATVQAVLAGNAELGRRGSVTFRDRSSQRKIGIRRGRLLLQTGQCYTDQARTFRPPGSHPPRRPHRGPSPRSPRAGR